MEKIPDDLNPIIQSSLPKNCRIALGIYLWDYTGVDPVKKDDPTYAGVNRYLLTSWNSSAASA